MTLAEVRHQLLAKVKKQHTQIEKMKKSLQDMSIEGDELVREFEQNKLSMEGEVKKEEKDDMQILNRLKTLRT